MPVFEYRLTGTSHKAKGQPCQDACGCCITPDGFLLLCVADGVSSSPHAEEGSRIAVDSLLAFWQEYALAFTDDQSLLCALEASFNYAFGQIMQRKGTEYGYETTLHAALLCNEYSLYYGNAGDGGLFIRAGAEPARCLTEAMKDEDGASVVPLSAGPKMWQFGCFHSPEPLSVLLATDGLRDVLCSPTHGADALAALTDPSLATRLDSSAKTDAFFKELILGKTPGQNPALKALQTITDDITLEMYIPQK